MGDTFRDLLWLAETEGNSIPSADRMYNVVYPRMVKVYTAPYIKGRKGLGCAGDS